MYIENSVVFRIANVLAARFDGIDGVESTGSGIATLQAAAQIHGIWNMP
jgi:hypothetical protein